MMAGLMLQCAGRLSRCLERMASLGGLRARNTLLALGDSFDFAQVAGGGKTSDVLSRMKALNPRLMIENGCKSGAGLLDIGTSAGAFSCNRFEAAIAFVGNAQAEQLDIAEGFVAQADFALAAFARIARRRFLVAAFDYPAEDVLVSGNLRYRLECLERTLRHLCTLHGVEWIPLRSVHDGCAALPIVSTSFNFSVGGFYPQRDSHEMWTACMLQRPALARLVFR